MTPADPFFDLLLRTYRNVAAEARAPGSLLGDPARLMGVALGGEARRAATTARLGIPAPRMCIISVTWACNLACIGCYAKGYRRGSEMDLATIVRVVREATALGTYLFVVVGGEPLLVDGLAPALAEVRDGLFLLFTNGTLLDADAAARLAAAGNILPVISLEGDAARTDERRGSGVGARVRAAMDNLRSAGLPFAAACMTSHRNVDLVTSRAWWDELWDAGARLGFLNDYVPQPGTEEPDLLLTADDLARKAEAMRARNVEGRPTVVNFPPDEYTAGGCQSAGRGFLHINAYGDVEPCPFSHYAADNLRDRFLAEALASPFFAAVRKEFAGDGMNGPTCRLIERHGDLERLAAQHGARKTDGE